MKLLLDESPGPRLADSLCDWLAVGNAGTQIIAAILRARSEVIREFSASVEENLLVLELFPRQD